MSLEAVIEYFSEYNMDHRVMVSENSTATVEEAAQEHGVNIQIVKNGWMFVSMIDFTE